MRWKTMSIQYMLFGKQVHCRRRCGNTRGHENALKQYTWMLQTLQHYRTKQENLWVIARKEVRERAKKQRRAK